VDYPGIEPTPALAHWVGRAERLIGAHGGWCDAASSQVLRDDGRFQALLQEEEVMRAFEEVQVAVS